jgi:hypothetical protein
LSLRQTQRRLPQPVAKSQISFHRPNR